MPEPYRKRDFPLSRLNEGGRQYVRIKCTYCKREHVYMPDDLIQVFGDVDVDSLSDRMKCEGCNDRGTLDVRAISPTGSDAVGMRLRRLVAIKIKHVPVWREG